MNLAAKRRKQRPPNPLRRVRSAGRKSEQRDKLLEVGARLFARRGIASVSVAELIDAADVSRATFYGFFASKTELASAILEPVFDAGIAALEKLRDAAPRDAAEGLVDVYLHLWNTHRDALLLTGGIDAAVFAKIECRHRAFNESLLKVVRVIESGALLRNGSAELTLEVLARTGIPLLRVYAERDDWQMMYRESITGLILNS